MHLDGTGERPRILELTAAALIAVLGSLEQAVQPASRDVAGVEKKVTASGVFDELLRHEATTYWSAIG